MPNVLVVNAASNISTLQELIAAAKAAPDKLTYSSGGNGSAAHIAFEALKLRAGISVSHIPYRGTGPSVTDLLGGQVDATFTGAPAVLPHIKSSKLRALAVSGEKRIGALPDVPTVAESGFAGFDADQWYGLVAPAGLPADQVTRFNTVINETLALPDVIKQLESEGATPVRTAPQAFTELITREIPRWKEVIRAGNVKVD